MKFAHGRTLSNLLALLTSIPCSLALATPTQNTTLALEKRSPRISFEQCLSHPDYFINCCKHSTTVISAGPHDCYDYSDKRINVQEIGKCETNKDTLKLDHGPYCSYGAWKHGGNYLLVKPARGTPDWDFLHQYRESELPDHLQARSKPCREKFDKVVGHACNEPGVFLVKEPFPEEEYVQCQRNLMDTWCVKWNGEWRAM